MENIAVGDEVGYYRIGSWGDLYNHGFAQVAKINRHGHVHLSNGLVFDRYGTQRNVKGSALHLCPADEVRARVALVNQRRSRDHAARVLGDLINTHRNGHGHFIMINDPKVLAQLIGHLSLLVDPKLGTIGIVSQPEAGNVEP